MENKQLGFQQFWANNNLGPPKKIVVKKCKFKQLGLKIGFQIFRFEQIRIFMKIMVKNIFLYKIYEKNI